MHILQIVFPRSLLYHQNTGNLGNCSCTWITCGLHRAWYLYYRLGQVTLNQSVREMNAAGIELEIGIHFQCEIWNDHRKLEASDDDIS